jgi:hypothetical protein
MHHKKVVIKIGDVSILMKIIQVNCIGNLCLDFNFGKNLMKIVPHSINKGLMGPKQECLNINFGKNMIKIAPHRLKLGFYWPKPRVFGIKLFFHNFFDSS